MKVWIIVGLFLLAGCITTTGVVPMGEDTYMIGKSSNLTSDSSTIKAAAYREAIEYCAKLGKKIQVVRAEEQDMRLGSHVGTAEIQFMCLDEDDPELNRPKLRKEADQVIEVKEGVRFHDEDVDIYTELKKLNELKEAGILTQEEFDIEKKKILAQ